MASEMGSILIRNSVGGFRSEEPYCSRCKRMPLVGELLYELASGRHVCSLCVANAAASDGEPVGSERIRSSARPLAVVQHRAA